MARYQQAELLRLRGDFDGAEEGYREASTCGHPVQPGLALLRLAQGRVDGAVAAIRGLPLLVTLGRTGTATVLANVAAMGTLILAGDEGWVRTRQRTMSLEIATSRVSVPVEVAVAGDDRLNTLTRSGSSMTRPAKFG